MSRRGWLLFAAMSVFWGIPYFFIKIAIEVLDPIVVVLFRVLIATVVLLPVAVHRGALRPLRGNWVAIGILALVQVAGPFVLITYAEEHISSSLASLIVAADPLLVVLFALRLDQSERVGLRRALGLLIGITGVAALVGFDVSGDQLGWLGAGMTLVATAGYALGALMLKRRPFSELPSLGIVAAECAIAVVAVLPLAVNRLPHRSPPFDVVASLVVLGVVCTGIAWLAFFELVAEVGSARAAVFTYVNPTVAIFLGVTVLGESLTVATVVGLLLIAGGSWLSTVDTLPPLSTWLGTRRRQRGDLSLAAVDWIASRLSPSTGAFGTAE